MAGSEPYERITAAVRRAVDWTTGGGRPILLMAGALTSGLFLGAQWLFALRLGFRPDEIGIGPTASIAHAAVGLVVVLLAVGSTVLVIAGFDHVVALLTAVVWELAILARGSTKGRRRVGALVAIATGAAAVAVAFHVDGKVARPASIGAVSGTGLLGVWALWGGVHRADPFPVSPRWEVSWLGGMLTTTALIGAAAAYLDVTDELRSVGTTPFLVVSVAGAVAVAVALAVLSSGSPPAAARWLPTREHPGVVAVGTVLLAAVIVGCWTLSTAVHDARVVRQGHVPNALGRFVIGIPVQCVEVHMLQASAIRVDRPLLRLGSGSTTLLVEPGHGVMHLPTGAVQTVGRADRDCSG